MKNYVNLNQNNNNSNVYEELVSFWINNTNFTEVQSDKFINLIEEIDNHSKEIIFKQNSENRL